MARFTAPTSGDAFASLLDPVQRPLARMEAQDTREEDAYWAQEEPKLAARRQQERAGLHAGEAAQGQEDKLTAQFGTSDPEEVARKQASGIFGKDLPAMMRIDPEGTAAKVQREVLTHETGSAQGGPPRVYRQGQRGTAAPAHADDDTMIPYTGASPHLQGTMVRKGSIRREFGGNAPDEGGSPYFTNLSDAELSQQSMDVAALTGQHPHPPQMAPALPAHDLVETGMVDNPSEYKSPAQILYQGKLDQMKMVAEAPGREDARIADITQYRDTLLNPQKYKTMNEAIEAHHANRESGLLGKMRMKPQEDTAIEREITQHGLPYDKYTDITDPTEQMHYRPWDIPGADKSRPASVVNPLGALPPREMADTLHNEAIADHAAAIDESMPREQPTGYKIAKQGYGSQTALKMSKAARRAALEKANAPANPLMGRLESDRQKEIAEATRRLNEE